MNKGFWVKFQDKSPTFWRSNSFDEFWHDMRNMMIREPELILEWIIRE